MNRRVSQNWVVELEPILGYASGILEMRVPVAKAETEEEALVVAKSWLSQPEKWNHLITEFETSWS